MNKNAKTEKKFQKRKKFDKNQRGSDTKENKAWTASRDEAGSRVKGTNDASWYCTDPQVLNDVARIPYSLPVGYPLVRNGKASAGLLTAQFDDAIPGIAAMEIIPTLGNAEYANDAVNVAGNGFYTFLRHLNSGSRNYDPVDSLIYVMSMDSVYYMIAWATRLYATLSLYAQGNRYLPDALLLAQGVDYVDFRKNMAQFRAELNQAIRKISTLVIPSIMPIFKRHSWLFSNYFIEGESIKDQIYLFKPLAWYKFGLDSEGAGMLSTFYLQGTHTLGTRSGLIGVDDLLDIINTMIDPIFADEDFNIMSGDILKAYGEANVMKLGLIPDELPIGLAFDEKVLLQFKNAKPIEVRTRSNGDGIMGRHFYDNMFDVVQSEGKQYLQVKRNPAALYVARDFGGYSYSTNGEKIEENLVVQAMFNQYSKAILLSSPHATVEPEENMENTRLTLALDVEYDDSDENPQHIRVNHMYFGSEWPNCVKYWCMHKDKTLGVNTMFERKFDSVMVMSTYDPTSTTAAATSYLPIRSAFKYAPEITMIVNDTESQTSDPTVQESGRSLFEVDNYTLVDPEVVSMLHNAATLGEYNIPRIALFAS